MYLVVQTKSRASSKALNVSIFSLRVNKIQPSFCWIILKSFHGIQIFCYNCKKTGHMQRDCPEPQKNPGQARRGGGQSGRGQPRGGQRGRGGQSGRGQRRRGRGKGKGGVNSMDEGSPPEKQEGNDDDQPGSTEVARPGVSFISRKEKETPPDQEN